MVMRGRRNSLYSIVEERVVEWIKEHNYPKHATKMFIVNDIAERYFPDMYVYNKRNVHLGPDRQSFVWCITESMKRNGYKTFNSQSPSNRHRVHSFIRDD